MKESKRKCFKCGVSPSDNPRTTLHRFPKPGRTNSLRCELWAKDCFPDGLWYSPELQINLFSEHNMLCSKHFKKSSFIDESLRRLFKSAAPTKENDKLYDGPCQEPIKELPLQEFEVEVDASPESTWPQGDLEQEEPEPMSLHAAAAATTTAADTTAAATTSAAAAATITSSLPRSRNRANHDENVPRWVYNLEERHLAVEERMVDAVTAIGRSLSEMAAVQARSAAAQERCVELLLLLVQQHPQPL